jgi:hypothetical protein
MAISEEVPDGYKKTAFPCRPVEILFFAIVALKMARAGNSDWETLTQLQKFERIFACCKSAIAGGADGSVLWVNGTVNSASTEAISQCLEAEGQVDFYMGTAQGMFMFCAAVAGGRGVLRSRDGFWAENCLDLWATKLFSTL